MNPSLTTIVHLKYILKYILALPLLCMSLVVSAQDFGYDNDPFNESGSFDDNANYPGGNASGIWGRDTTSKGEKEIPIEYHQWYIDERVGTRIPQAYNDTLPHLFQNFNATDGLMGEYNMLGNLGSPRYARNWLDVPIPDDFMFVQPFSQFHTTPSNILYTNTKSPVTNLQYHKSGTRQDGQDRFRSYFATNINKQAGFGFKVDYLYGRGYYINQASSEFGGNLFGYYHGDRYEMHAFVGLEHMKMAENGGIDDDQYITNPQSFPRKFGSRDIPTILSSIWNRNDQQTYFLTHRYNLGYERELEVPDSLKPKVPSEAELLKRIKSDSLVTVIKADSVRLALTLDSLRGAWQSEQIKPTEFIPVSSIVHTIHVKRLQHTLYGENGIPSTYFTHQKPFYTSNYNSIHDLTEMLSVKNTLGLQLREGFNRWAKAGITLFASHELKRFKIPSDETIDTLDVFDHYTENHVSVGGQILKTQGRTLHFDAGAEFWVIGPNAGDLDIYGATDLNFRLGRDTVRFDASASFKNLGPAFVFQHFHSEPTWWDNDLSQETRTRIEGRLTLDRTQTSLRFGLENISNYTHFASLLTPVQGAQSTNAGYSHDVEVRQQSGSIQVMSATLHQDFGIGPFHWDNDVTWQHSSKADVLPLPMLSLYTNPYFLFTIAKVLRVEIGADMRYFTSYYAPDYSPIVNNFTVQDTSQERVKIGNYPIINAYANFAIKRVRGYINVSHVNSGTGHRFWAPHYPIDPMSIRFGISWNFYD